MNLTYKIEDDKYIILKDNQPWIIQEGYYPYLGQTLEESAQKHIEAIIQSYQETFDYNELAELKEENSKLKLALAELAEQQEQNTLQTQLALAELAEVIVGGDIDRG